jgi:hypothetical protein
MRNMTNRTIGLSMSQRRALSDMGIDVWVRRGQAQQEEATVSAPHAASAPNAQIAPSADSPARGPTGALPATTASVVPPTAASATHGDYRAELDCLATVGIVLIGRWQNALDKRLAHDIAITLGGAIANEAGMVQSANVQHKLQQTAFRWPATQTGDASFQAARGAFKAFVRGQAERAQARCTVLFGDAATMLAEDVEAAVAGSVVRQPSIGVLRADPNAKKTLWLNVSQNVLG